MATDWASVWSNSGGKPGWQMSQTNPDLKEFGSKVFADSQGVFVPLCGKTVDMIYLAQELNFSKVIGVELVEEGAKQFFADNDLTFEESTKKRFRALQCVEIPAIEILVGSVFDLSIDDLRGADCVWDRAAAVALEPNELRPKYWEKVYKTLELKKALIVAFDFGDPMSSPPYTVTTGEVRSIMPNAELLREGSIKTPREGIARVFAADLP